MLFSKVNDKKIRDRYNLLENKKKIHKFLLINFLYKTTFDNNKKRFYIYKSLMLKLFRQKIYKSRIVPHCLFTYRTRGVNKRIKLSRLVLRDLMQFGLVPGYKKAVW